MPPRQTARTAKKAALQASADRITQRLTEYYILHTLTMMKCQTIGIGAAFEAAYEASMKEWKSNPDNPSHPPADNDIAREEFYAKCDRICATQHQATTVHQWFIIGFACYTAMWTMREQEVAKHPLQGEIYRTSARRSYDEFIARHNPGPSSSQADIATGPLPNDILSAAVAIPQDVAFNKYKEDLMDRRIRYRDPRTRKFRDCAVVDFGSSHVRGYWVELDYGSGPVRLSMKELEEILANEI